MSLVLTTVEIMYDMTCSEESAEVNVSDHEYEVEHNKRNRPEIPRGGGGKKRLKSKKKICFPRSAFSIYS